MAKIFSLFGEIFIDNEKANKSIDDTTNKGKTANKSFVETAGSIAKNAAKIGTAMIGVTTGVVAGLGTMANKTAETADEIDKASIRMGISTKSFQELKYAAGQCGVEMTTLEKAGKKLEGSGLNLQDAMNQIMSYSDATERAKKAQELFGDSVAYQLSPLIEQSQGDYDGLIQRANDLGLVMSDTAVKGGVEFGDLLSDLKQGIGGVFNKLGSALMPVLNTLLTTLIANLPTIQAMIDAILPILVSSLDALLPVFTQLVTDLLPILLELAMQLLPPLMEIIQQLLPIFIQILEIILPPLIDIIQALLPALLPILDALIPILEPILELLTIVINTVLLPIIKVITSIAEVISKVLVGAINILIPVVKGISQIFSDVFGGLFNIVKVPINFIIDGLNLFIKTLNKIKIPDWVPAFGGKGINLPLIQKLRVGLEYVPYDEMPAILHKGERILTAEENKNYDTKEKKEETINYYNTINIDKLEVREENDIKRISEELYYLQLKKV